MQWPILLVASYVFYGWNSPLLLIFLLFSTLTTWIFPVYIGKIYAGRDNFLSSEAGKQLDRTGIKNYRKKIEKRSRWLLVAVLLCNLGVLLFFKYSNFFISIVRSFGADIKLIDGLILPLGISFYTFQSIGYCIDVYRETVTPQYNFFKHALYVSFFPQISMGPIGRYGELAPQLFEQHILDWDRFVHGLSRVLLGLFKKIFIADSLGTVVSSIYDMPENHAGFSLIIATILYAFQLYADFSGYMDMAIGISNCLGIKLNENFSTPYFSHSITEFWRRWHISLGNWFRDYLFYPVLRSNWCSGIGKKLSKAGHKKLSKTLTTIIGLAITWIAIGFWHGASSKYVLYGMYHGFFIIIAVILEGIYDKLLKLLHIKKQNPIWNGFQIFRTFFIVCVGYVLFRASDLANAINIYHIIAYDVLHINYERIQTAYYMLSGNSGQIVVALLCCVVFDLIDNKKGLSSWWSNQKTPVRWGILYIIMLIILLSFSFGNGNENAGNFIYFNF